MYGNVDLQLGPPDEQPGAMSEIAPSPDYGRSIDRPFNERTMVLQAWEHTARSGRSSASGLASGQTLGAERWKSFRRPHLSRSPIPAGSSVTPPSGVPSSPDASPFNPKVPRS